MTDEAIGDLFTRLRHEVVHDLEQGLEQRINAQFRDFRNYMDGHFDAIYKRLDRLEQEYQALKAAVGRLEQRMQNVENRLDGIERRLAVRAEIDRLKTQITDLQQRVTALENEIKAS